MGAIKEWCNRCDCATDHRTGHCPQCNRDVDRYDCPKCGLGSEGPHAWNCDPIFAGNEHAAPGMRVYDPNQ